MPLVDGYAKASSEDSRVVSERPALSQNRASVAIRPYSILSSPGDFGPAAMELGVKVSMDCDLSRRVFLVDQASAQLNGQAQRARSTGADRTGGTSTKNGGAFVKRVTVSAVRTSLYPTQKFGAVSPLVTERLNRYGTFQAGGFAPKCRRPTPALEEDSEDALRAAFRRDPDTGSMFGQLTPRRMLVVFCAELLGTALLLFMGCMSTVAGVADMPSSPLQVSIGFGMTVASIIQIIGHISVAHINPAVTLCAVMRGDLNVAAAGVYFVAQNIGAILGFGMLLSVTPSSAVCECTTVPAKTLSALQSVMVEAGMTAVLILLCNGVWDARNARNTDSTPLKFGFLVAAVSIVSGPYTGGSMNPARTLGPAIWRGEWTQHWVYWVGPFLGSAVASLLYLTLFDEKPAAPAASRNRRSVEDGAAGGVGAEKAESIPLN